MKFDLRTARWFGRERASGYARMMAIAFTFPLVWFYLQAIGPTGSDFLAFWSASHFTLEGAPAQAYSLAAQESFQKGLGRDHFFPFLNPPPFLFLTAPLGLAPYEFSLLAWVATTYAVWLAVAHRLAPGAFWPVAVFPGAMVAAWHAQNGFVTGALLVGAALTIGKRPWLAGALLGALIVKPHLALLVPLALIAGREWRAFAGAAISAAGLLAASSLVFGDDALRGFLASTSTSASLLKADPSLLRMPTVFGTAAFHFGSSVATALQVVFSIAAAGVVWWVWSRTRDPLTRFAVLVLATPLATPYLYHYDLAMLIAPVCWLAREGAATGFRPWEKVALAGFYWSPFLARAVAEKIAFNPMPIVLTAFLIVALTRIGSTILEDSSWPWPSRRRAVD